MKPVLAKPLFFATPADFRAWLEAHHENTPELCVGFYKKGSGQPSITWPEAVDEALCVGRIDGLRKTIDPDSYRIRFTPRKPTSNWSALSSNSAPDPQLGSSSRASLRGIAGRRSGGW